MGAPPSDDIYAGAGAEIEELFRKFLSQKELDGYYPGIPTKASLDGVNHRLAKPNAKGNTPRPSFIDTGLFESAFRSWVESNA